MSFLFMSHYQQKDVTASNYRWELYKIFDKLDDNDLIKMYHILNSLGLSWFVMSYCIEILEDRQYDIKSLPKRVSRDIDL